jgi:hypothetical protein
MGSHRERERERERGFYKLKNVKIFGEARLP